MLRQWSAAKHEGQNSKADGRECGGGEDVGELELEEAFEGADAEGSEAVAELVEGDEQPCGGRCDGGHLFLAEADEEREHGRAAEAGEREGGKAGQRRLRRQERGQAKRGEDDQRQDAEDTVLGEPAVDRGEEQAPAGDHSPKNREAKRRGGGGVTKRGGHQDRSPVAIHRFADAVEQRGGGEGWEGRRQAGAGFFGGWRAHRDRERQGENEKPGAQRGNEDGQAPPKSEAHKNGHEGGCERGAEAEEGVQREQGAVGGFWKKCSGAGVDDWHCEAEGHAHESRSQHQQRVGSHAISHEKLASDQQCHG